MKPARAAFPYHSRTAISARPDVAKTSPCRPPLVSARPLARPFGRCIGYIAHVPRRSLLALACALSACHEHRMEAAPAVRATTASVDAASVSLPTAPPPAASSAPVPSSVLAPGPPPSPIDAAPRAAVVFRVLDHAFIEDDAGGAPKAMWIKLQVEVDGEIVGPFRIDEPSCTLASPPADSHVLSRLSCYYAGGGDYVEVRQKRPREYLVIQYYQGESYIDEPARPAPPKTLGTIHTTRTLPRSDALVAADGVRLPSPYYN